MDRIPREPDYTSWSYSRMYNFFWLALIYKFSFFSSTHSPKRPLIHPLTHPPTHSFIHPLLHSLIYPLTHTFTHSSIHQIMHPLINPPTQWLTHPTDHPPTHQPTDSLIQPTIHPSTHSSINWFTHSLRLMYLTPCLIEIRVQWTITKYIYMHNN